ncbi:PREDICTED: coiled-coil domain-containing protein 148 isoform X3 [Corvus brachyrhynchos]|uniref:coiled-coil domain-containing protein 148 isoform X3 n=1 Tax=Corvus brachyrhynchos TaxID=85066 RepID=UPI0008163EAD|nr:PREDICTED: coiled-coil domain-containing protein 148 isoform X3 [Corvus brachyrhynchos]
MGELDHGALFSGHRISGGDNLVIPARNALCSRKYKPVDYKHLYELAAEAKMASAKTQLKIKKTEQVSKTSKERRLLKQHRQVWWQEHKRLSESRQKAEGEMKTFVNEESHKNNFFFYLSDLEQKLSKERDTYQTNALVPVWQLKEDLKLKLAKMQRYLSKESCQKPKINSVEVLQQIKFMKKQQKAILEGLILESLALERELEEYKENALVHSSEEKNGLFLEVPPELLSLECPYPDLKTLVIDEYQELASGYRAKLQEIDQQLEALSRSSDWKEEDQWVFQTVINQYPSDLQRRRTLYLDMLQRYLPHKSRQELVVHEKAWDHCHSIRNQRRVLLLNWAQARKAFVLRAVATAAEAAAAHEAEVVLADSRQKQLEICADLKAKVLQWKAQQEEAAKLEAAVAARRKKKEDERERLQREQETVRRAQDKEKVAVVAKLDPARAVADTVASRARLGIGTNDEFELQQPLFRLHTYSEEQVISDPRLRVELALREAGLHKTLYAREVLSKLPPLKLPRRDMESTAFSVEHLSSEGQRSIRGLVWPTMCKP